MATPPQHTASHPLTQRDPRLRSAGRVVGLVETVSPRAATALADAFFCRTTRRAPRPDEAAFLGSATSGTLTILSQQIVTYRWPGPGPRILLAHGWGSHPGRFAPMASPLLAAGADLLAFDAPGHGASTGWRATMPEFARTMRVVADHHGPIDAVIGHSLGGAAAIFAADRGMEVHRLVTIATPSAIGNWLDQLRDALNLSTRVDRLLRERLMRRLHVTESEIDLPRVAPGLSQSGLVIHDADDPDVPIIEAEQLVGAWPMASLMRTHGLGHRAILRDPDVIRATADFALGS
ncbi:MAG: alpha/beta hydrolase [Gemmatimonadota bacterium]